MGYSKMYVVKNINNILNLFVLAEKFVALQREIGRMGLSNLIKLGSSRRALSSNIKQIRTCLRNDPKQI